MNDGNERVTFTADGRRIEAKPGQTVGAALWAHGDRAFSRSMKYHRPRAWSCGVGRCNDCAMRIDGTPNVKACVTPARDGMMVEGQNAWPNVRRDLFRANDIAFHRGLDHHTSFVRPRFLYPLFTKVMRGFAGWGTLPDHVPDPPSAEALRPDVLVVGGGPAGLAAARHAADTGADVLLLEEAPTLGGHARRMKRMISDPDAGTVADDPGPAHDIPIAALHARWLEEVTRDPRIDVRTGTSLAATYGNGLMIAQSERLVTALRPRATVIAVGGHAAMASFAGNDLPGVMTAAGAQALLNGNGVTPGRRAIVYGAGAHGCHVALDLHEAGTDVVALIEPAARPPAPPGVVAAVQGAGIPVRTGCRIERARGWGRVRGAEISGSPGSAAGRRLRADLIVVALGQKTAPEPFQSMGCTLRYVPEAGGAVPVLSPTLETSRAGLFAAGDTAGIGTLATARASGALAGLAAARHAGRPVDAHAIEWTRARLDALAAMHGGPVRTPPDAALEVPPIGS